MCKNSLLRDIIRISRIIEGIIRRINIILLLMDSICYILVTNFLKIRREYFCGIDSFEESEKLSLLNGKLNPIRKR